MLSSTDNLRRQRDPRAILKLRRCPQCDYDLEGLPRCHQCPECGFAYDESMFVLYGWPGRRQRPVVWRALITVGVELPMAIFIFYLALSTLRLRQWPESLVVPLLLSVYAFRIATWIRNRRLRLAHGGMIQLCFASNGVGQRLGRGKPHLIPWKQLRAFHFRRAGRDVWHLQLSRGVWGRVLSVPFVHRVERRRVYAMIECDRREAALIRNEIRRRFRAAHGGSIRHGRIWKIECATR